MRAQDRHLARRQSFLGCMRLHLDASTATEAFSLGSTTGPFTVEALESAGGNTGNADNYLAPPNHFQPAVHPWMETGSPAERAQRAETPGTICRPRFINDIGHFAASCTALSAPVRRTVAWRKSADTPCTNFSSRNCPQFCCLTFGGHSNTPPQNR